ncbi:hypothetical protein B566_EDAN007868, partial [Ephemera danica]
MMNSSIFEVNASVPLMSTSDLGVFGAMLGASAIIGVYFGCCSGRKQSASEYLMGGKRITVLGVPTEIYLHGTQYWLVVLSGFLVTFVIAVGYVPVYIDLQLDSCYQYLELRFDKRVRRLASIIFVCAQGGLRAVVWADTLQTVLMFAATIVVLAFGTSQLGGWSKVWERNEQGHRLEFFNFNPSPLERHTVWTVFIGSFFLDLGCVTNQGMVQRVLAVPNLRSAQCVCSELINFFLFSCWRRPWLRVAAVLSGVICVAFVFVVEHLGGVLQVTLSFNGITIGTMLGIFTLGMFFPKANSKGALAGATASLLLVGCLVVSTKVAITRGDLRPHNLPVSVASCLGNVSLTAETSAQMSSIDYEVWPLLRLSYMYYSLLGCLIVLLVGLPVSSWSREENEKCDPRLISNFVRDFI